MKEERKPHLNVAILGDNEAGKVTLTGHLLSVTGAVPIETVIRMEQDTKHAGIPQQKYAWLVHKLKEEKKKGTTIKLYQNSIETKKYQLNLYNTPALKEQLKATILGISQSDCAAMVVSCLPDQLEVGIGEKGRTMEHALIAYTYGLRQLVVCINKMDLVQASEEAYLKAKERVGDCLKKAGFNPAKIAYIPISAWAGHSLTSQSPKLPWYQGPTLLELIDSIPLSKQVNKMPFRLAVENVLKMGKVGTVVTGKVLAGTVKVGLELVSAPKMLNCIVESMQIDRTDVKEVSIGQSVGIHLGGIQPKQISCGDVIGPRVNGAMGKTSQFTAHIMLVGNQAITADNQFFLYCHTATVLCIVTKIEQKIDKFTGKLVENNPHLINGGEAAIVTVKPLAPVCMEVYNEFPALGRFLMVTNNTVFGVGVTRTVEKV